VLSSQLHIEWALATGGTLEDRPRYNKSRCFETFPFPDEDTGLTPQLRERIAQLAEQIDAHRKRVLGQACGGRFRKRSAYEPAAVPACPGTTRSTRQHHKHSPHPHRPLQRAGRPARRPRAHGQRENHPHPGPGGRAARAARRAGRRRAGGLRLARHASTDDILAHLVQLNTQRAAEEAQGRVRWLRPDFQNPQNSLQKQELLPQERSSARGRFG
jgi:hypothetical protein